MWEMQSETLSYSKDSFTQSSSGYSNSHSVKNEQEAFLPHQHSCLQFQAQEIVRTEDLVTQE